MLKANKIVFHLHAFNLVIQNISSIFVIGNFIQMDEDGGKKQNNSLFSLFRLNKTELPYILLGVVASFVLGAAYPIYALLYGDVMGVRHFDKMFLYIFLN